MNTDAVINAAQTAAIRLLESGAYIPPDSTVCALQTLSGRIFTGISRNDMNGHTAVPIHAEVDAVQNMLASGERTIAALIMINTQNRMPMLPCNNCIGYIISLDQRNAECLVIMPDRMIKLTDAGMYASSGANMNNNAPQAFHGGYQAGRQGTQSPLFSPDIVSSEKADGDLLRNKVNSLLNVAEDDEEEENEKNEKPKKGLFGLFRKDK